MFIKYCVQRFAAWRCGGLLALMFIRYTNVEPCTKVSTKHVSPHNAKPLLPAGFFVGRRSAVSSSHCHPCVGLVALLYFFALVCALAKMQMCHQMCWNTVVYLHCCSKMVFIILLQCPICCLPNSMSAMD